MLYSFGWVKLNYISLSFYKEKMKLSNHSIQISYSIHEVTTYLHTNKYHCFSKEIVI